ISPAGRTVLERNASRTTGEAAIRTNSAATPPLLATGKIGRVHSPQHGEKRATQIPAVSLALLRSFPARATCFRISSEPEQTTGHQNFADAAVLQELLVSVCIYTATPGRNVQKLAAIQSDSRKKPLGTIVAPFTKHTQA